MTPRLHALAIAAAAIALSPPARAQDECTKMIIYAVKQFCSLLPNGQSLCQPVALTGPSPACEMPAGTQLKPVPLAPPTLQMPNAMFPATGNPYAYGPLPFAPYSPFPPPNFPGYTPPQFALPAPMPPSQATPPTPKAGGEPPKQAVAEPPKQAPTSASLPTPAVPAPVVPAPVVPASVVPASVAPGPVAPPVAAAPPASPAPAVVAMPVAPPTPAPAPLAATPVQAPATPTPASVTVSDALTHFDFDSAELTEAGRATLDAWLASAPVGMPVVVSGHADRLGAEPYNLDLSLRRAMAARDYLVARGKDARDIRVSARGEVEPVKQCRGGPTPATKDCLAPNRRVEIKPE